jgi:ribonuclease D
MQVIKETQELNKFCQVLKSKKFITVDTEFLRDKTYFPKLCLIQIAAEGDIAFAIDPLAFEIDLQPLFDIFNDPNILKVFHAARQDIEIILKLNKSVPRPLFDTQLAAMVCGFGDSVSYESLVKNLLNVQLDKTARFTDWSKRPLTDKQIHYALSDVIYLKEIYLKLKSLIDENSRMCWLKEEMDNLTNPTNYEIIPKNAWLKLKLRSKSPKFLHYVKELATWRELTAQKLDVPRNHLLKEEALIEIAASEPLSVNDLKKIRNLNHRSLTPELNEEIIQIIIHTKSQSHKNIVPKLESNASLVNTKGPLLEILKLLLKIKSEEHQVAEKLIASMQDLSLIVAAKSIEEIEKMPPLNGWKYEIFGKFALEVIKGRLAIKYNNNKIELININ